MVPQGNLAERMRAAGAGIGAFFSPTGVGTPLAEGKERAHDRRPRLRAGVPDPRRRRADQGASRPDTLGNLVYRKTARNFGPVMAAAATTTIVAGRARSSRPGGSTRRSSSTPGIYVDRWSGPAQSPIQGAGPHDHDRPPTDRRPSIPTADRSAGTRSPSWSPPTSPPARTSTSASASRPRSPTTSGPAAGSSCTPRTACSGWVRRRTATRSTRT